MIMMKMEMGRRKMGPITGMEMVMAMVAVMVMAVTVMVAEMVVEENN